MYEELIKQARELFEKACPLDGVTQEQSLVWGMIPQLCDALEAAQKPLWE